jgi:SAM-dependent methyltransferase
MARGAGECNLREGARRLADNAGLRPFWHLFLEWRGANAAAPPPARDAAGVAVPPAGLMVKVVGHADWPRFEASGRRDLAALKDAVDRNGGDFAGARRILDLGCGCGRLARHLPAATRAEIFGVDYNANLARWCARHLDGAYSRNRLAPPLAFPDGHFDVVYLISVFTHQRLETQTAWLAELKRVLAPGGFALVTFHDEDNGALAAVGLAREELLAKGFVIRNDAREGSNFMAAFQSRAHFRRWAEEFLDVAEIVGGAETGIGQTLAVLRAR